MAKLIFTRLIKLRSNTTVLWMVLPFVMFWSISLFTPTALLIQVLNCILIAMAAGVAATYFPTVREGVRSGEMPRYTHLAVGIFFGWMALVMARSWSGISRVYPEWTWMKDSSFVAFYIFTSIMAAVFHISAPGAINGVIPTKNWIHIGIAVMIGVLIGIIATFLVTGINLADAAEYGGVLPSMS